MTLPSSPSDLAREYRLRFEGLAGYRDAVWSVLCREFFSRYIGKDSTVLDLGAGWGEFIRNIGAARKLAMDLNPETKSRVPADVTVFEQDCSTAWPLQKDSLDVVFTSNFLEHLPDKPSVERTVREAYRCLRPGGLFICLGPNIRYVQGAYFDFWDHHVALTDASLAELLALVGFGVERQVPRFLPYSMSRGSTPPMVLLRLYLRMPFIWPVFGKQFLVVARKGTGGQTK